MNFYVKHIYDKERLCEIRDYLCDVIVFYPNFFEWWNNKVVPGIESKRRHVIVAFNESDEMIGVMVLKNGTEKKISTLYVRPPYTRQFVGRYFIEHAMRVLETRQPLITVPKPLLFMFEDLFKTYGFQNRIEYPDYYLKGVTEVVFNGTLQ